MSGYTRRAAAVIQALQRAEDEREIIWSGAALLAILNISPVDSVLAHALRSNLVWNQTMREQFRAAMSGRPGNEHLRPRSMSGIRLQILLENAERLTETAGDALIAERHLAMALAAMLRDDLRTQGIDWQRMGEEVARMERSPERARVEKALELEDLRFAKAREEIEGEASSRSSGVQLDMVRRGLTGSGLHLGGVIEAHIEMLRAMARRRVELRRETVVAVPELGTTEHLDRLKQEVEAMVDTYWANLYLAASRWCGGVSAEAEVRRALDSTQYADTPLRIKNEAGREGEMLKREVVLGMRDEPKPGMMVNIKDSVVAGLNLGTVMGNIQSVVVSLQQSGNDELAKGLKDLIERVAAAEEIGGQRRDVIESLTAIGEQAALPREQQRPGVVKALLTAAGVALSHTANVAQIWQAVGPMIARHFGLPWP